MSELFDKEVNAQKESLKKLLGFTQAPGKPTKKCVMKMKKQCTHKNVIAALNKAHAKNWGKRSQ